VVAAAIATSGISIPPSPMLRKCVRERGATLDVDVTDDGQVDSTGVSPGLGLQGMAERCAALGGRLDVGPLHKGGWRVHAMLPLRSEDHQ
jgi:glucose-6-phosphate-specific signal transduction histidine kinase